MGQSAAKEAPARPPVPAGRTRICVIGFSISHNVGRAARLANAIAALYPDEYETWFCFDNKFRKAGGLLETVKGELTEADQTKFADHKTAPFCWLESEAGKEAKGGRDRLCEWAAATFPEEPSILALANTPPSLAFWNDDLFPSSHKPTCGAAPDRAAEGANSI